MELQELEYDHTLHTRDRAGDEKLYVRFFTEVLPDEEASKATGMRKFRDAEMITIQVPGDKRNIVVREAREDDKERFSALYKKFRAGMEDQQGGYPLKEWPLITRAMAEEFKYLGFHTVEQLASANDTTLSKYPGMREVSNRAKTWLQAQADAAPMERLQTELQTRDQQIAAMQQQINQLMQAQQPVNQAVKAK
jgi:hypothetical protein